MGVEQDPPPGRILPMSFLKAVHPSVFVHEYEKLKVLGGAVEAEEEWEEEKHEEEEEEEKEEKRKRKEHWGWCWKTDSVQAFTLRLSFLIDKVGELCLLW